MYVPSSELGNWDSPNPSLASECTPPPAPVAKGWGHTRLRVRGWGSPNSDDWRKSLALCLFCVWGVLTEQQILLYWGKVEHVLATTLAHIWFSRDMWNSKVSLSSFFLLFQPAPPPLPRKSYKQKAGGSKYPFYWRAANIFPTRVDALTVARPRYDFPVSSTTKLSFSNFLILHSAPFSTKSRKLYA